MERSTSSKNKESALRSRKSHAKFIETLIPEQAKSANSIKGIYGIGSRAIIYK
jgi:hypothetical protein